MERPGGPPLPAFSMFRRSLLKHTLGSGHYLNFLYNFGRIHSDGARDIHKLNDIQAAFTKLIFSYKGLRTAQPFCNFGLGKARFLTPFTQ